MAKKRKSNRQKADLTQRGSATGFSSSPQVKKVSVVQPSSGSGTPRAVAQFGGMSGMPTNARAPQMDQSAEKMFSSLAGSLSDMQKTKEYFAAREMATNVDIATSGVEEPVQEHFNNLKAYYAEKTEDGSIVWGANSGTPVKDAMSEHLSDGSAYWDTPDFKALWPREQAALKLKIRTRVDSESMAFELGNRTEAGKNRAQRLAVEQNHRINANTPILGFTKEGEPKFLDPDNKANPWKRNAWAQKQWNNNALSKSEVNRTLDDAFRADVRSIVLSSDSSNKDLMSALLHSYTLKSLEGERFLPLDPRSVDWAQKELDIALDIIPERMEGEARLRATQSKLAVPEINVATAGSSTEEQAALSALVTSKAVRDIAETRDSWTPTDKSNIIGLGIKYKAIKEVNEYLTKGNYKAVQLVDKYVKNRDPNVETREVDKLLALEVHLKAQKRADGIEVDKLLALEVLLKAQERAGGIDSEGLREIQAIQKTLSAASEGLREIQEIEKILTSALTGDRSAVFTGRVILEDEYASFTDTRVTLEQPSSELKQPSSELKQPGNLDTLVEIAKRVESSGGDFFPLAEHVKGMAKAYNEGRNRDIVVNAEGKDKSRFALIQGSILDAAVEEKDYDSAATVLLGIDFKGALNDPSVGGELNVAPDFVRRDKGSFIRSTLGGSALGSGKVLLARIEDLAYTELFVQDTFRDKVTEFEELSKKGTDFKEVRDRVQQDIQKQVEDLALSKINRKKFVIGGKQAIYPKPEDVKGFDEPYVKAFLKHAPNLAIREFIPNDLLFFKEQADARFSELRSGGAYQEGYMGREWKALAFTKESKAKFANADYSWMRSIKDGRDFKKSNKSRMHLPTNEELLDAVTGANWKHPSIVKELSTLINTAILAEQDAYVVYEQFLRDIIGNTRVSTDANANWMFIRDMGKGKKPFTAGISGTFTALQGSAGPHVMNAVERDYEKAVGYPDGFVGGLEATVGWIQEKTRAIEGFFYDDLDTFIPTSVDLTDFNGSSPKEALRDMFFSDEFGLNWDDPNVIKTSPGGIQRWDSDDGSFTAVRFKGVINSEWKSDFGDFEKKRTHDPSEFMASNASHLLGRATLSGLVEKLTPGGAPDHESNVVRASALFNQSYLEKGKTGEGQARDKLKEWVTENEQFLKDNKVIGTFTVGNWSEDAAAFNENTWSKSSVEKTQLVVVARVQFHTEDGTLVHEVSWDADDPDLAAKYTKIHYMNSIVE